MLRQWEYLYHINTLAKPWPVYVGVTKVHKINIIIFPRASAVGTASKRVCKIIILFWINSDPIGNYTASTVSVGSCNNHCE